MAANNAFLKHRICLARRCASFHRPKPSPAAPTSNRSPSIASFIANPSARPRSSGAAQAKAELVWFKPWKKVLEWKAPFAKWFVGGQLNVSYNCLDRHLDTPAAQQGGDHLGGRARRPRQAGRRAHAHLHGSCIARSAGSPTCSSATASRKATACSSTCRWCPRRPSPCWPARASARCTRSSSAASARRRVADRINDCQAKLVITADGGYRRGAVVPLKQNVDEALTLKDARASAAESIEQVIVLRRANNEVHIAGRPRPLVAPRAGVRRRRLPAGADGQRGTALHPLHQRHHRQAQGHPAHHRRLPARRQADDQVRLRPAATTTSTGARPTSAGSRATATSSTARWPTARPSVMYEGAPNCPDRTASGASSRSTASRSSTPRRPRSAPS